MTIDAIRHALIHSAAALEPHEEEFFMLVNEIDRLRTALETLYKTYEGRTEYHITSFQAGDIFRTALR